MQEYKGLIRRKSGIYYYRYKKADGNYTGISFETGDLEEAKKRYNEIVTSVSIKESDRQQKIIRISDLYNKFFEYYTKAGKDAKALLYPLIYMQEFLQDPLCDQINKYQVNMFMLHRQKQKKTIYNKKRGMIVTNKTISATTVNIEFRFLRALFSKAVEFSLVIRNPFLGLVLPKSVEKKKKTLSEQEMFQILIACDNNKWYNIGKKEYELKPNVQMKNMIKLSYMAGFRVSEITNLPWECVDFAERVIHIKNQIDKMTGKIDWTSKTKEERTVPMNDDIHSLLQEQYSITQGQKYVFCYVDVNGQTIPYTRDSVSKYFKRKVRECGLSDDLNFHCLRHTACTNLIERGVSVKFAQEIMGHSDIHTTMKYTHVKTESLREAMNTATVPKGF